MGAMEQCWDGDRGPPLLALSGLSFPSLQQRHHALALLASTEKGASWLPEERGPEAAAPQTRASWLAGHPLPLLQPREISRGLSSCLFYLNHHCCQFSSL